MNRRKHRRNAQTVLRLVKGVLLGTLTTVLLVSGMRGSPASSSTDQANLQESLDEAYSRVVARAMADQQCSSEHVPEPGPSSALVRTVSGDVRIVSFEYGWDVYNGRQPGSLIAVCLGQQPTDGQTLLKVAPRG